MGNSCCVTHRRWVSRTDKRFHPIMAEGGGISQPDASKRSITVPQLEMIIAHVKKMLSEKGGLEVTRWVGKDSKGKDMWVEKTITDINEFTLYDMNKHLIIPATKGRQCSLSELISSEQQQPNFFVSHWWGEPVVDFLACLKKHSTDRFEGGKIDGHDVRYWVCAYCNNQHKLEEEIKESLQETSFYRAMRSENCQGTVVVLDKDGKAFTRIWCVFEFSLSTSSHDPNFKFDMVTRSERGGAVCLMDGTCYEDEQHANAAKHKQDREHGFPVALLEKGTKFKAEVAEASVQEDKDRIIKEIQKDGKTMEHLNVTVRAMVAAAGAGVVFNDAAKLADFLKAVKDGGASKLAIGPSVKTQDQVKMFLDAAVPDKLTNLYVGTKAFKWSGSNLLSRFGKLRVLHLTGCGLDAEDGQSIGKELEANKSLITLNLGGNNIGDQGATGLGKGIEKNECLTTLDLYNNNIGDQGATGLGKGIEKNECLTTLSLDGNKIGDQGATGLGKGIEKNECLTTLTLDGNEIGDQGATRLGKGIEKNECLTTLDLTSNNIGDQGATGLGKGIEKNECLTTLYLDGNKIGDQGATGLGKGIEKNECLTTLYLTSNNIGDQGATGLGKGIEKNECLTTLYLRGNGISPETKKKVNAIGDGRVML